jgi:hypothetical protein
MTDPVSRTDPAATEPSGNHPVSVPFPLLRWPAEDDRRRLLASLGQPRLLLLAPDTTAPPPLDALEICVHDDTDPSVIVAGVAALQRQAQGVDDRPVLDDDGLLWFRHRWIAVSEGQMPVVALLVENYKQLVHHHDLTRTYQDGGGSQSAASLRTLTRRISQRLAKVGLQLHVVRRRGVLLAAAEVRTDLG